MHRSRLAIVLIDHPEETHDASLAFWAGATGRTPEATEPYHSLGTFADGITVATQRVSAGSPPRVHLDIETDDVEAEVARLEGLGARRLRQEGDVWQLLDPGGVVFCVVPVENPDFDRYAVTWDH